MMMMNHMMQQYDDDDNDNLPPEPFSPLACEATPFGSALSPLAEKKLHFMT